MIFLTAAAQPEDRVRGLMVGAVDYIAKPFDFDEVRLRVSIHLQAWRQAPVPSSPWHPCTTPQKLIFISH